MDAEPVVYPYLEEVNQSVLRVVTPPAGAGPGPTVLDVGCGYGALARELSARGLRVWGIERDPKATAVALERMDRVIVADFTDGAELAKELGGARFDVIMFSDVLEHTVDPGGVLSGFLDYLSDDGRIVVSVAQRRQLGDAVRAPVRSLHLHGDRCARPYPPSILHPAVCHRARPRLWPRGPHRGLHSDARARRPPPGEEAGRR